MIKINLFNSFFLFLLIFFIFITNEFFFNFSYDSFKWYVYLLIPFIFIVYPTISKIEKFLYLENIFFYFFFICFLLFYLIYLNSLLIIFTFIYYFTINKNSVDDTSKNINNLIYYFISFLIFIKIFYWIDLHQFFWKTETELTENYLLYLSKVNYFINNLNIGNINLNFTIKIYNFLYLIIAFLFFILLIFLLIRSKENTPKKLNNFIWYIPVSIILFVESFSTYSLFGKIGGGALHHWQVYISTIELIKNGGYLLWDVPSQYGFFSIISLVIMPFEDPWLKMYFLNCILNFILSIILFKLIWHNGNIYWYLISIFITCAVYFILASGPSYANISETPSNGALRYFWVVIIAFVLFKYKNLQIERLLLLILPFWIIGTLWSIISAFVINLTLLPIFIYFIFFYQANFGQKFKIILLYFFVISLTIFAISIYYIINIGNLPDYLSFFDFAINGIGTSSRLTGVEFNYYGVFLVPILFISLSLTQIIQIESTKDKFIGFSFLLGFWALLIYAFDRGVDLSFLKQLYLYFFFFLLILRISNLKNLNFISPLLIIILFFTYSNPKSIIHFYNSITNHNYSLNKIEFNEKKEYHDILNIIKPKKYPLIYLEESRYLFYNTRSNYLNNTTNQKVKISRNFMPTFILASTFVRLNEEAQEKYITRWLSRNKFSGGWFITSKKFSWHEKTEELTKKFLIKNNYNLDKIIYYNNLKAVLYSKI